MTIQAEDKMKIIKPAHNSNYKKLAVQWIHDALCFLSSSFLTDSFRLRNRHLRQSRNLNNKNSFFYNKK